MCVSENETHLIRLFKVTLYITDFRACEPQAEGTGLSLYRRTCCLNMQARNAWTSNSSVTMAAPLEPLSVDAEQATHMPLLTPELF